MLANSFFNLALQYYLAGRSVYFACSIPAVGNLFHHAVEMLLKSNLLERGYSAKKLQDEFGHNLKKLWKEYKGTAAVALSAYDDLINRIHLFEGLRYPKKSFTLAMDLRKGTRSKVTGPATKGFLAVYLALEEVDELTKALLNGVPVTPEWVKSKMSHGDAEAQYKRENHHCFF